MMKATYELVVVRFGERWVMGRTWCDEAEDEMAFMIGTMTGMESATLYRVQPDGKRIELSHWTPDADYRPVEIPW